MLVYLFEGDEDALSSYLEDRLSKYLPIMDVSNPPEGYVRARYDFFPPVGSFGGKFPNFGVSQIGSEGRSRLDDAPDMPGTVDIGVRIHHPSNPRSDLGSAFGIQKIYARHVTRVLWSAFRKELFADDALASQVYGLDVGRVEMGDYDRFGNPYEEITSTGRTLIWVLGATVRFYL